MSLSTLLLLAVVSLAPVSATSTTQSAPDPQSATRVQTVPCERPYEGVCVIKLSRLQEMERTKTDLPIEVDEGDIVIWVQDVPAHRKFKLNKFVQADCIKGTPNNRADPDPFINDFSNDTFKKTKASEVNPKATRCSCFKHSITFDDDTKMDPHVIIGPGIQVKDGNFVCSAQPQQKPQQETRNRRTNPPIDPATCLDDGTCQDCPEPKSASLCEISTAWLRADHARKTHLPVLLHWSQQVIWYTPISHATIDVRDFSEVSCTREEQVLRKRVDIVKMQTRKPAPSQSGFISGKIGACYKHNIVGGGGEETGVDPHVIIGPGLQ